MIVTTGTSTHALGSTRLAPTLLLSWYDGVTPTAGVRWDVDPLLQYRPTAIIDDGASGVYVAGMVADVNERFHPTVTHFDASGAVAWSKKYVAAAPFWSAAAPNGGTAVVGLGEVVAGKIAMVAGSGVAVIDTAGAMLWQTAFTPQLQLHQIVADAAGFTAYGFYYAELVTVRFDWAGTLVAQAHAPNTIEQSGFAPSIQTPYHAQGGRVHLPFSWSHAGAAGGSGVLVVDATGAVVDTYAYAIAGEYDPSGIRAVLVGPTTIRPLSDTLSELTTSYSDTSTPPPYLVVPTVFVFPTQNPAIKDLTLAPGAFTAVGSKVMALSNTALAAGRVGAPCSYTYFEITALARTAGTPIPTLVTNNQATVPLTVTTTDMAVTTSSAGTPTVTLERDACNP